MLYVRGLTETYAQAYMLETGINVQSLGSFEPSAEELATQMLMQDTAATCTVWSWMRRYWS